MGMIGNYQRISLQQLQSFQEKPDLLEEYITKNESSDSQSDKKLCIGKAWDALHFLLTNSESIDNNNLLSKVVLGGTPIYTNSHHNFYIGVLFLHPREVKEISLKLLDVSENDLKIRFNPSVLLTHSIYPAALWVRGIEVLDFLIFNYKQLVIFFQEAAKNEEAIIFYIQ